MATDNKQKVLIRSMSVEEIENYLFNSDLNGKIIPKNEDTWNQSNMQLKVINSDNNYSHFTATILTNLSKKNNLCLYIDLSRLSSYNQDFTGEIYNKKTNLLSFALFNEIQHQYHRFSDFYGYPVFRPLIEYKE